MLQPLGYPCTEHTVATKDGFVLSVQRVQGKKKKKDDGLNGRTGPPVFLQHGLFQGGDTWFVNCPEESLGFILADHGFDIWVGNVRGTRWSRDHVSLSVHNKEFWDWSWEELALNDLVETRDDKLCIFANKFQSPLCRPFTGDSYGFSCFHRA